MRPEIILIVVCSALIFASVKSLFDRENSNMTIDNFYVRDDWITFFFSGNHAWSKYNKLFLHK